MRVGQALGLRHGDFVSRRREVRIVARPDNANGARAKLRSAAVMPGVDAAGALVFGVHARRVRRPGLRLRVREPVRRAGSAQPLCYPTVHRLDRPDRRA
jgi:hypothetical protein